MNDLKVFLDYIEFEKKYSNYTIINYKKDIIDFLDYIKSINKDYKILDHIIIRDYLEVLFNKKLSRNTISRKLSSLRSFYNFLFQNNYINENPFKLIMSPKKEKTLPNFLGINDIEKVFDIPDINMPLGQRDLLILEVFYATGVRLSELINIQIKDIDFFNKEIKVFGKGKKTRIVNFGEYCLGALNLFINDGRKIIIDTNKKEDPMYLIINSRGSKISSRGVEKILEGIGIKANLNQKFHPHMLRHSFATHLLNEGCDILTVQEFLGHESIESTSIYTHVSNQRIKDVYLKCHPRAKK